MTPDGLIPCGCGGNPVSHWGHLSRKFYVECNVCGIQTALWKTEVEAKATWNKAMSGPSVPLVGTIK